jgi:hypothetical protein
MSMFARTSDPVPRGTPKKPRVHPGVLVGRVLVAKVGYFGVKSTKVHRVQMGTKPAKVGRLGPRCAKVRRGLHAAPTGASAKRSSIHAASKVAKVGAAGGPKLLKYGRLRRGRVKSAKVRPQAASHKKVFAPQKKVFAPRADQSC